MTDQTKQWDLVLQAGAWFPWGADKCGGLLEWEGEGEEWEEALLEEAWDFIRTWGKGLGMATLIDLEWALVKGLVLVQVICFILVDRAEVSLLLVTLVLDLQVLNFLIWDQVLV